MSHPPTNGLLIVLSGPSGVGKDAAITSLKQQELQIHHIVTATTRQARPQEIDEIDYIFLTPEEFQRKQINGELLEWANVHGKLYGTPLAQVQDNVHRGRDVLLKIDVQGARQVKQRIPNAVFIFLAPPSIEELVERLTHRRTESREELEIRIRNAYDEMAAENDYDYVVVNHHDRLDDAVAKIRAIIVAERCRVVRRHIEI